MTHKPPQGIDARLRIDEAFIDAVEDEVGMMSGGWDNVKPAALCEAVLKVAKLAAPPDPRKDLAARLESLSIGHRSVSMRWKGKHDPAMEDVCESCGATWAHHAGFVCLETGCKMDCPRCQLEALVAEMRGAKR